MLANDGAISQLKDVASHTLRPSRMMKVIATSLRSTKNLDRCTPMSLLGVMMTCASLGLEPNTPLGHAYILPFFNGKEKKYEAQLIIGYKGLIDLAFRSGRIRGVHCDVVYSDDELWEWEYGTRAVLRHKPGPRRGEKRYAYAHARLVEGGEMFLVLPWEQVLKIRDGSRGYQSAVKYSDNTSPWIAYEDAMAAKTAFRALAKYIPLSIEMATALELDDRRANYADVALSHQRGQSEIDVEAVEFDDEIMESRPEPAQVTQEATQYAEGFSEPVREPAQAEPQRRARGRPAGSKNKPKPTPEPERERAVEAARDGTEVRRQMEASAGSTPDLLDERPEIEPAQVDELISEIEADLVDSAYADDAAVALKEFNERWAEQLEDLKAISPERHASLVEHIDKVSAAA